MGNPEWYYEDILREAERILGKSKKINITAGKRELENKILSYKSDDMFLFNCGYAAANVMNIVLHDEGTDGINAAINGLNQFENLVSLQECR
jgi:hypothetical protein